MLLVFPNGNIAVVLYVELKKIEIHATIEWLFVYLCVFPHSPKIFAVSCPYDNIAYSVTIAPLQQSNIFGCLWYMYTVYLI